MTTDGADKTCDDRKEVDDTEEDDKGGDKKIENPVPVDRGWAWVVLAGAMLCLFVMGGVRKNFGIFFVAFQDQFGSSASTTSLILTIQSLVNSVCALFTMTIGMQVMSTRQSIMIGSVVNCASYMITAFAEDIRILFISMGCLTGFATSWMYPPIVATVSSYFDKRLGLANSLTLSGSSLGGFVCAPFLTFLLEQYGYRGTIIITAGLMLNCVVFGAVMRPLTFWQKGSKTRSTDAEARESLLRETSNSKTQSKKKMFHSNDERKMENRYSVGYVMSDEGSMHRLDCDNSSVENGELVNGSKNSKLYYDLHHDEQIRKPSPLVLRKRHGSVNSKDGRQRTTSQSSSHLLHSVLVSVSQSDVALYASCNELSGSVASIGHSDRQNTPASFQRTGLNDSCCKVVQKGIANVFRVVFDMSLLSNPVFLVFLLMAFLVLPGQLLMFSIMPAHGKDIGISSSKIGVLMSIISAVDLVSRIVVGIVVDQRWMKKTTVIVVSALIIGTASHFIRFFTTFESLAAFAVLVGICCGLYIALYATILVDLLTLAKLKSSLGFTILCHGISVAIFFPILGRLRDSTGDYLASFHLLGGLLYAGAALALLLPYIHQWRQKRNKTVQSAIEVNVQI